MISTKLASDDAYSETSWWTMASGGRVRGRAQSMNPNAERHEKQITCSTELLNQRFSIPVFVHPRSAYFACLSLLTHLIQVISLLEVSSMHELCSDWHGLTLLWINAILSRSHASSSYYMVPTQCPLLPTQCPLLPTPWSGEICWSLLHFRTFIHGFALRSVFTHRRNLLEKCEVWHNIPL